jgi:hypothetical protein
MYNVLAWFLNLFLLLKVLTYYERSMDYCYFGLTHYNTTILSNKLGRYCCDQTFLDTNVIVLSYILKRPLCINNLNFDCVNFENVNVRFTEKIFKKLKKSDKWNRTRF